MNPEPQMDLPSGWVWTNLGEITYLNPNWWDFDLNDEDYVSFVPMAAVEVATGNLNASERRRWEDVQKGFTRFQEGDVLFAKITPSMENGKSALAVNLFEGRGAGSTEFHVLRPIAGVNPKLILYFLLRQDFRAAARLSMKGAAGFLRVPAEFIAQSKFPLPPLAEQQRIVEEIEKQFAAVDATIANLKEMEANLKKLREETLTAACEGRLVPNESELAFEEEREYESGEELLERILKERREKWEAEQLTKMEAQGKEPKDDKWKSKYQEPSAPDITNLPDLPEGWTWANLKSIAEIKGGITKDSKRRLAKTRSIPYLRVANVQRGFLDLKEIKFIAATEQEIEELHLIKGDILFTEGGDLDKLGRGWVWDNQLAECIHQNHIFRARLFMDSIEPKFISFYTNIFGKDYFIKQGTQTTNLASINLTKLGGFPIPLPPLAEQQRIVDEVEKQASFFDEREKSIQENLKRTEGLRQTVLKQAFEGKLVAQNPSDEPASVWLEKIKTERLERETLEITKPKRKREKKTDSSKVSSIGAKFPFETNELKPMSSLKESEIRSMRLITLKLDEDYKSLHELNQIFRYDGIARDSISPICLVGLNGSGKSNLIESLSEIFCYLELINLPYESIKSGHKKTALRFEMEYELPLKGADPVRSIRIKKHDSASPIFLEVDGEKEKKVVGEKNQLDILPTRIIGYSSGLNETISIPFFKTKALYSKDVGERAKKDSAQKNIPVEDSRTLFMDYESNAAILLANYLFKTKESLDLFREHLRIDDIASFEITIQLKRPSKQRVLLTPELEESIARLKKCASGTIFERGGDKVTFTYEVSLQLLDAFRETFINSKNFFKTIYKLSLLNALALDKREREFYLREGTKQGLLEKPPTVSKEDRIFSINRLRLKLTEPEKEIDYAGISDGEHQFIHVFGTVKLFDEPGVIFLLDEPETHFNPRWRREFVQILDNMPSTKNQEFVISTHSPFIVSGCRRENVFKFERKNGIVNCKPVDFETYGASFEFLLTKLFNLESLISETALEELKEVIKSNDLEILEAAVNQFGESFEKRFLFEKIVRLKKDK